MPPVFVIDQSASAKLAALKAPALPSPKPDAVDRIRAYEAAVQERPNHAPTWNNLGSARAEAGQMAAAQAAFETAARLDPNYTMPHRNLAMIHRTLKNLQKAAYHEAEWKRLSVKEAPLSPRPNEGKLSILREQ